MKRGFCFTVNNYEIEDICHLKRMECQYLILGEEVGECGTPHLQCFVYYKNAKTLSAAEKCIHRLCKRAANIVACKGSPLQNYEYCSKDGKFHEMGDRPKGSGKRSDIDTVRDMVKSGCTRQELYDVAGSYQAYRFGEIGLNLYAKHREGPSRNIWRWGLAGVGKTRWVFDNFGDIYVKDGTQWWDGYEGQEVILIDDFDGRWPYRDLLRLLDRYPYRAQVKGSYVVVNSTVIVITCEHPPDYFWQENELAQVTRRIEEVIEVTPHSTEVGGNNRPRPNFEEWLNNNHD